MLVAKCSVCKTKAELQACEVCEEAKCVKCAQQHLTELKTKWKTIETRVDSIKQKTNIKQTLLVSLQQTTEKQLSNLKQHYDRILGILKSEYETYLKQLSTSKSQYNNKSVELEKRWNELQANALFQKWIATTDGSRYLLMEDSSLIEKLITDIESYLSEQNNDDFIEYTFAPSTSVSLGKLSHVQRTSQCDNRGVVRRGAQAPTLEKKCLEGSTGLANYLQSQRFPPSTNTAPNKPMATSLGDIRQISHPTIFSMSCPNKE